MKLCLALLLVGIFTFSSNAMVMSFSRLRPANDDYFDYNYEQEVNPKVVTNPRSQVDANVEDVKKTDLVSFLQDSNVKKLLLLLYYKKYGKMPGEFPMLPAKKNPCNRRTRFGSDCRSLI